MVVALDSKVEARPLTVQDTVNGQRNVHAPV